MKSIVLSIFVAFGVMVASSHAAPISLDPLDCTLDLTVGNSSSGFGTGNFGTVHLVGDGVSKVTVTISLLPGWDIIKTGFPGVTGFTDSLSGAITIGDFSSNLYSGSATDSSQDLHFDGFGYEADAAGTTGPHNGSGVQTLTFTITQAGLNNVNYLLNWSGAPHGDGSMLWIVDAGQTKEGGATGLIGAVGIEQQSVPEPTTIGMAIAGLAVFGAAARRKRS